MDADLKEGKLAERRGKWNISNDWKQSYPPLTGFRIFFIVLTG